MINEREPPEWLAARLTPGRELRATGKGWFSAVREQSPARRYDRYARAYDRLVGNWAYNRFVWGSSVASYERFAAQALTHGDGPLLDAGCGTTLFTAGAYRDSARRLVLVDRSAGMLARAAARLGPLDPGRVVLVQADLFDLPFRPASFATVVSYGVLHLFADPQRLLRVLGEQRAPGGSLWATSLVSGPPLAGPVLRLLHAAGETAPPRRVTELAAAARAALGEDVQVWREGGMAYLRAPAR